MACASRSGTPSRGIDLLVGGRRPALERPPTGLRHRAGGRALPRLQGGGLCGRRLPPTRRAGVSDPQHARPPGRQVALREDRTLFLFIFRAERTDAGPSRKTSCARSSATPAGNARRCSTRSTTPTTCTSMWSARSRWITGRVAGWGSSGTPRAASHCLAARAPVLAMTEAYVLAGEWTAPGDHREAFEAYEALMHPFVASKQAGAARFVGFFATRTKFGLWLRNIVMRAMNVGAGSRRLVAGDIRDDLELPQYAISRRSTPLGRPRAMRHRTRQLAGCALPSRMRLRTFHPGYPPACRCSPPRGRTVSNRSTVHGPTPLPSRSGCRSPRRRPAARTRARCSSTTTSPTTSSSCGRTRRRPTAAPTSSATT